MRKRPDVTVHSSATMLASSSETQGVVFGAWLAACSQAPTLTGSKVIINQHSGWGNARSPLASFGDEPPSLFLT